jgi:Family of unknown function (DUF5677)
MADEQDVGRTAGPDMNEAYSPTPEQEVTFKLNEELAKVAADIRAHLQGRWKQLNVVDHFFITQFGKAQRTFLAIHALLRDSLIEDALCLLRVLVENTINLKYGISSNPVEIVRRYWDWAMLDTVRRARASNWFRGTRLYSDERKEAFLTAEAEIQGRYSSDEFESLKRNVFGISLETRAKVAGLSLLYDASYRVLSRNVHAMDVAVMEITQSASSVEEYKELLRARTSHLLDIAQWCLGTLAIWVNGQFQCGFDDRLKELQARS